MIEDADLVQLLPAGHSVGSIRTRRPLMYIFSGGNEDAAFFSVNGFSILLDGGDRKDVPYWNLIRNYDKISAAVITRVSPKCLRGISAILMRKCLEECHPNFGSLICNLPPPTVANGDSEAAKVLRAMHEGLRAEGLKPIEAFATTKMEPITLYEVIGEGALRMIVLNPERGSKDLTSLAHALKTDENIEKFAATTSLAVLLVWHPADHSVPVTRILITGACPLEKLYASLEKLKSEEYLRHPEFTEASKEKPAASRVGKVIRKPPAATTGKTPPVLPAGRSAAQHSSGAGTQSAGEPPLKKVVKQPLAGAALSRLSSGGPKKPATTPAAKPPTAGGNKPHTAESKVASKPGKPGANDAKKNAASGTKPKEGEKGKAKPVDKAGAKTPEGKEQAHGPAPVPTDVPHADVPKSPVVPESPPASESPQKPTSPELPEVPSGEKSPHSPASPQLPKSPVAPQVPDDNGLLDGIEEPMKVRKISMDFSDEDKKHFEDLKEKTAETVEKGFDLLDSAPPPQDTPLLDSTPMSPSAPPVAPAAEDPGHHSPVSSPEKEEALHDEEDEDRRRELIHKKSIQELLGAGTPPFMAGLVTGIVDDSPTSLHQLSPMNADESDLSKSPITPPSLNELNNGAPEHELNEKPGSEGSKPQTPGIERETFSVRSNVSSDSVTAEPDPALDQVIDSLADASELVDDAKVAAVELEHRAHGLTHLIDNAKAASITAAAGVMEHAAGMKAAMDERITGIVHDINDNANALANQNAYEEAHAEEMYLPPMTSTQRTRAKLPANGVKTKPKLTQPLYFDIVFVPHHGAHPALKDEEAAKAFVTSVRSRRYILSGKDSIRTYFIDGLIAGKTAWNKPELEVDVLPTHDSDELTLYSHEKAGEMAESGISLRCSVERCTLRLSSGGTDDVCAAFKFEM